MQIVKEFENLVIIIQKELLNKSKIPESAWKKKGLLLYREDKIELLSRKLNLIKKDIIQRDLFYNLSHADERDFILTFRRTGGGGFSMLDTDFTLIANRFFKRQGLEKMKRSILMTHAPPFRTKLDLIQGEHRGNKSIRAFIDEVKPHLVVCGHLHENAKKYDQIDRTLIVNPGPEGMVVEI